MNTQTFERKMDWHLFWAAAGVVLTLGMLIVGCYISLNNRLLVIETVMITQGHNIKWIAVNKTDKIDETK